MKKKGKWNKCKWNVDWKKHRDERERLTKVKNKRDRERGEGGRVKQR